MSRETGRTMFRNNNPFSLLDNDQSNMPDTTEHPAIEARKAASDQEWRTASPRTSLWAGHTANGQIVRALAQIWVQSGENVYAFIENVFDSEYLGLGSRAFEGLPAWAVPLADDFDEERHIGWETHKYALERRLLISVEIDPSPKQAWLKPVLNPSLEAWIRDHKKRLHGVCKLWKAYDFLCKWALDMARNETSCPILFALDNYTEDSIRRYRLSVSEAVKQYKELMANRVAYANEGLIEKRKNGGGETMGINVWPGLEDDEDDDDSHSWTVLERHDPKARTARSSNTSIKRQPATNPTITPIPTPADQVAFTRRRPGQNATFLQSLSQPTQPNPFNPQSLDPSTREEVMARMDKKTHRGSISDSFSTWSRILANEITRYSELKKDSDAWSSIDEMFQCFLQELCRRFPPGQEDHAARLQEWAREVSRMIGAQKAERREHARADSLLKMAMGNLKK
ncbi:hypothetical protein F5Y11DRAFT_127103 [Daldinia sp. FL1419]|nr:hypothetical protein F5Y11DRAFT_127103 [Daldinia sp. FL1419]